MRRKAAMNTKRRRSTSLLTAVCVLAIAFARPSTADAAIDWIGWFEGFSGPGPSHGFDLSFELACLDIVQQVGVNRADIELVLPQVTTVGQAFDQLKAVPRSRTSDPALEKLKDVLIKTGSLPGNATDRAGAEPPLLLTGPEMTSALTDLTNALSGEQSGSLAAAALANLKQAVADAPKLVSIGTAAALQGFGQLNGTGKVVDVPATTRRSFAAFGLGAGGARVRSCHRARPDIDKLRQADRRANALLMNRLTPLDPKKAAAANTDKDKKPVEKYVLSRQDWQTGLVLGVGRYTSVQNVLFDPNGTLSGPNDEPQLRTVPIELLAHSRLSQAVDIGAGLGIAWFQTQTRDGVQVGDNRFALYYVPFSAVIKPAAMFVPDNRFAAAIGYRFAVRKYGALDGTYFGTTKDAFKGQGEFIWGTSVYFDVLTLLGK